MKPLLLLLLGCCCCLLLFAQTDAATGTCDLYRTGYFSYADSLGNTVLVDRHKKYQYEKNTATGVKKQFRIRWVDSCSYQITQTLTNSRAARKFNNSSTLIIIEKTDGGGGYAYSCNCAGVAEKTNSGFMKKISKKEYYSLF